MNHLFYFAVSAALMTLSLVLFRWTSPPLPVRFLYSLKIFFCITLYNLYFVANYFTGQGITSSVIYHLRYGLEGAGFGSYINLILLTFAFLCIGLLISAYAFYTDGIRCKYRTTLSVLLLLFSLTLNPASLDLYSLTFTHKESRHQFSDFYINDSLHETADEHPNFILIYAESLERTYFDETLFPGLIKELKKLENESTSFTDIRQLEDAGWTMGGMVASQCGIPLYTPSGGNSMGAMDSFLPGAECFSDSLYEKGYFQTFMGGAPLSFAGKGKLFASHHFSQIYGKDELLPLLTDKSYLNEWGIHDDTLLDLAYGEFMKLSQSRKKFGLTLLTLGTHHPSGYTCKTTENIKYGDGSDSMLNAIAASDHLLGKFIQKIRSTEYGANTVIVVTSDHLAINVSTLGQLKKGNRRNLFMVLDPKDLSKKLVPSRGTQLDLGSTILPFLGYNGSIGLGRNLIYTNSLESELNGIKDHLSAWKNEITSLWDFPKIIDFVEFNPGDNKVTINGRSFIGPLIIKLNDNLETSFRFMPEDSTQLEDKRLIDYVNEMEHGESFIWFDTCSKLNSYFKTEHREPKCFIIGQFEKNTRTTQKKNLKFDLNPLKGVQKISAETINNFIDRAQK